MKASPQETILVWELPVRIFHWALAASIIVNYFVLDSGGKNHRYLGYFAASLILFRIFWGLFLGNIYSRFKSFWPTYSLIKNYTRALIKGQEPRILSHNPLASLMMIFMCLLVLLLAVSGYMMKTDYFWGEEWLEEAHEIIANLLIFCSLLHSLAAIIESYRHKENLILSMIHGKKRSLD